MPVELVLGLGSVSKLGDILDDYSGKLLVVTGRASYAASGAQAKVEPQLEGRSWSRHPIRGDLPRVEEAVEVASGFPADSIGLVVAVGGGAVIDTAKLVSFAIANRLSASELAAGEGASAVPIVAIPTTAGSGSEQTPFAVAYLDGVKYSVEHDDLAPQWALVDPQLTYTMPPHLTASSGVDALSHAIESAWAVASTETSRGWSETALDIVWDSIRPAVNDPGERARAAMSEGAAYAGKAIATARTTASHALSYHLTTMYGVAHGAAVGITLPAVLRFNAGVTSQSCADPRGPDHVRGVVEGVCKQLGVQSPGEAGDAITELLGDIGLPTRLSEVGLSGSGELLAMAMSVNPERLANNPRLATTQDLLEILEQVV